MTKAVLAPLETIRSAFHFSFFITTIHMYVLYSVFQFLFIYSYLASFVEMSLSPAISVSIDYENESFHFISLVC